MPPFLPTPDLEHILDHTRPLWAELSNQSLFLTGGTGFFGHWFLETFIHANDRLNLNAKLTLLSRDPVAFGRKSPHLASHPAVTLHQGDVRSFTSPKGRFSHIIHAATPASVTLDVENPREMLEIIVEGTRRMLDFTIEAHCERFLLTSSGAVYGPQPTDLLRIPENYPFPTDDSAPYSAYAQGKRDAEALCALHGKIHNTECLIARCFAFVGPYLPLDQHFAAGNFLRDALAGQPIQIQSDGTSLRSYLYASDLMIWLWTILLSAGRGRIQSRVYNVGSSHAVSMRDLADLTAKLPDSPVEVLVAKTPDPDVLPARYVPDVSLAERELNLKVLVPLPEALKKTFDWYRLQLPSSTVA